MRLLFVSYLATIVLTGCTHRALTRNTVQGATTPMEIQYQMVLNNIAQFSLHPETLPAQVRLQDGTIQVGDGFGGVALDASAGGFGEFGPVARREVVMQWETAAVMNPVEVHDLRNLYRRALGLQPLPDPSFVKAERLEQVKKLDDEDEGENETANRDSENKQPRRSDELLMPAGWEEVPAGSADPPPPPQPGVEFEVPQGWFCLGRRRDVPLNACYVGRCGNRYAWVTADGVGGLADFTMAVLAITKLDPSPFRFRRGLAVTPMRSR